MVVVNLVCIAITLIIGVMFFDMSLSNRRTKQQKKNCFLVSEINLLLTLVFTVYGVLEYYQI